MTRGRKPKIRKKEVLDFLIEMTNFSASLSDLQEYVMMGCDVTLSLPSITSYIKNELGNDGYKKIQDRWETIRRKGHWQV